MLLGSSILNPSLSVTSADESLAFFLALAKFLKTLHQVLEIQNPLGSFTCSLRSSSSSSFALSSSSFRRISLRNLSEHSKQTSGSSLESILLADDRISHARGPIRFISPRHLGSSLSCSQRIFDLKPCWEISSIGTLTEGMLVAPSLPESIDGPAITSFSHSPLTTIGLFESDFIGPGDVLSIILTTTSLRSSSFFSSCFALTLYALHSSRNFALL
mmetsp:Transcript_9559/g.15144  ORF Transcript_9559/g.15144 Transcript_9559/m.15144 type:complete len:216 (+) Transcript_9559:308-955(+)